MTLLEGRHCHSLTDANNYLFIYLFIQIGRAY